MHAHAHTHTQRATGCAQRQREYSLCACSLTPSALIGSCPIWPSNRNKRSDSVHRLANNLQFYTQLSTSTTIIFVFSNIHGSFCYPAESHERHVMNANYLPSSTSHSDKLLTSFANPFPNYLHFL